MFENMSKEEKLDLLEQISCNDDSIFTNYTKEILLLMDDPDPDIKLKAILASWDYPSIGMSEKLLDLAENDPDEKIRAKAIVALGRYIYELSYDDFGIDFGVEDMNEDEQKELDQYKKISNFLLRINKDSSSTKDERRYAMEALSFLDREEISHMIQKAYNSGDPLLKLSAIFSMGRSGMERWEKDILAELNSDDPMIIKEAVKAAGECGIKQAGKILRRLTYAENRDLQLAAIWALGQTGWDEGYERLQELAGTFGDEEIQACAQQAMEEWEVMNAADEMDEDLYENGELDLEDNNGEDHT
ncbi:MAG: HEAT repeat domain-containing protein [Spirochaetales bacterium]|nr:HEAT repeat domain-containing protein [Spirochaetales bacterium]